MTWQRGFILQGQSDFEIFRLLREENARDPEAVRLCHPLHYMQMACEKLAKGLAAHDPNTEPAHTHDSLAGWVRAAKTQCPRVLMRLCQIKNKQQFRKYLSSLESIATLVDELAPAVAEKKGIGENAEYPWKDKLTGVIFYPAGYDFPKFKFNHNRLIKLTEFMEATYQFSNTYIE